MKTTHVFDLLDGKVGVGGDTNGVWTNVDDDHHRPRNEALKQLVNLLVRRPQLRSSMIPPNHPLLRYSPSSVRS